MGLGRWLSWFLWLDPEPTPAPVATPAVDPEFSFSFALGRRLGYLHSDAGADDRERILVAAHPVLYVLMLEEAGRHTASLLRQLPRRPAATDPALPVAGRVLEAEYFHAAQTGYVLCTVAGGLAATATLPPAATTGLVPWRIPPLHPPRGQSGGNPWQRAARIHGRARRLRGTLARPVLRWLQDWAAATPRRLAARGWAPPARLATVSAQAVEDLLYLGYAAAAEGRAQIAVPPGVHAK